MSMSHYRQAGESGKLIFESVQGFARAHPELANHPASVAGGRHWPEIAELGWLMLPFATADGGLYDRLELATWSIAVLSESLGSEGIDEPFAEIALLAGGLLASVPASLLRTRMIRDLISGNAIIAAAIHEPGAETLFHPSTRAIRQDATWKVDGQKSMVLGASAAEELIIFARIGPESANGGPEPALFAVNRDTPGLEINPYRLRDGHWAADVSFTDLRLPSDRLLARGKPVLDSLQSAIDTIRFGLTAEIAGLAERATTMTCDYTAQRQQFGRPVATFQVVEHRLVDMRVKVEQLRVLVAAAATAIAANGMAGAGPEISRGYAAAGTWGVEILQDAIQLHGGMGMTEELGLGRALCRAFTARLLFPIS